MISYVENGNTYELRGLSTDTKPTANVPNASIYLEIDTSKVYVFDKTNNQ